jgi:hypothetical protein
LQLHYKEGYMTCQILSGTFKNVASTPFFIPIRAGIDQFYLKNLTMSGQTALGIAGALTSNRIVEAYFNPTYMARGTGIIKQNGTVSGTLAPLNNGAMTINGIYMVDAANPVKGPNIAIASFVPGTTTTFTTGAAHGFVVGDNVRIGSLTSAPELGGLVMTVTAVGSTTTFTTLLNSTNSLTSVGVVYRVGNAYMSPNSLYYPQVRAIAAITLANPMVVTLLVQQNYQVGDVVRFQIPTVFTGGAQSQLNSTQNGLPREFTVIAVNNAVGTQTVTLNVDSTAFTAFAWPATSSYPFSLPQMIPQGEGNINTAQAFGVQPAPLPYANQNILGFATQNQACNGVLVGTGDGTNSATTGGIISSTIDAWEWTAVTNTQTFPSGIFP